MRLATVKPVVAGVVAAAAVIAITGAASGAGVGAVFNLGKTNKVNATSALTGSAKQPMLSVTNSGSGSALSLQVKPGKAPLSVNSSTQVPKLNASLVDGLAAGAFVQGGGRSSAAGFTMSTAANAQKNLLAVPGFGTFQVDCGPDAGGNADVTFLTGSHSMDKMLAAITTTTTTVGSNPLTPATNFLVIQVTGDGVSAAWERAILRYTTGSGASLVTHFATVDVMATVNGTTCDFDATAITR